MIKNKTVGGCVRNPHTPLRTRLGIRVRMANTPGIAVCIAILQLAQTAFYIYRATRTRMKFMYYPCHIKAPMLIRWFFGRNGTFSADDLRIIGVVG